MSGGDENIGLVNPHVIERLARGRLVGPRVVVRDARQWRAHPRDSKIGSSHGSITESDDVKGKGKQKKMKGSGKPITQVTGEGPYSMKDLEKALRTQLVPRIPAMLRGAGMAAGKWTGVPGAEDVFAQLGTRFGKKLQRMIVEGRGKYMTQVVPRPMGGIPLTSIQLSTGQDDSLVLSGCEKTFRMYAASPSNTFNTYQVPLTPINRFFGTRACLIARNYTFFCFRQLAFKFTSSTGDLSTGTLGTMCVAHVPDPSQAFPTGRYALENNDGTTVRLDTDLFMALECSKSKYPNNCFFVDEPSASASERSCGYLAIGLSPAANVTAYAELYTVEVEYSIEFFGPRVPAYATDYVHLTRTGVTNSVPLGTTTSYSAYSSGEAVGWVFLSSGTKLALNNAIEGDVWSVSGLWAGTSVSLTAPAITSSTNGTLQQIYNQSTASNMFPSNGATTAGVPFEVTWKVGSDLSTTPYIQFGTGGTLPASGSLDLYIRYLGNSPAAL